MGIKRMMRGNGIVAAVVWSGLMVHMVAGDEPLARELFPGISTNHVVYGKPYELHGRRVVFTNWYYIQPGDLDWRDDSGQSVYVHGDSGQFEAHHEGIEAPSGIRLMARKPQIVGPLDNMPHRCILRDGDVYRGWTNNECYESTDGMQWVKKANCTFEGPAGDGVWQVFLDPSAPPAERYKMVWPSDNLTRAEFDAYRARYPDDWEPRAVFHLDEPDGKVSCIRGSVSPDGIHWTTLADPLVVEYSDSYNTCYYDDVLHRYVLYTRYWSVGPTSEKVAPNIRNSWTDVGRRAIGRSESADFRHFPLSQMILEPTPEMAPSEQLYTNCHTTIPGAGNQHLMFSAIWNASITDTTRIKLASSHDGKLWHWVPGGDLMDTAPFGQWNGGCIWTLPGLIELPNGDWALPYLGHNLPHKYPRGQQIGRMGYALWPKGRLVALEAPQTGQFTLIPLIAPGKTLTINAVTQRTGWIKVEVAGRDGRTFADCVPIIGDQFQTQVTWQGGDDLGVEPGQAVTLRFQMHLAQLYALDFQ